MKTISSSQHVYAFTPGLAPVDTISVGESVCFDALDALGGQVRAETDILSGLDFNRVNPATGPVRIEGTLPGDTLLVRVESIEMGEQGAIVTGPGLGVLANEIENHATRILPIRDGCVHFGDLALLAEPMIGVIGVAPESDSFPTGTAHRHGGNMDTKEIGIGSTVYLPVFQDGAMLAMGDVHAVMGDGEVCVSACEVEARITVQVNRIEARCVQWPMVETDTAVHILVSLPTIEEALVEATRQAVAFLQTARGLSKEDAYMLASLAVDIAVSQLVDPNKTAKASIPKSILPGTVVDLI
ncbi:acetamidase/formamidase family protein [Candidatus Bipolaricaulota bacterium]